MKIGCVVIPDPAGTFDADQWEKWFTRERWCGGEHPDRAAALVMHIMNGIRYVRDKVIGAGFTTFKQPPLAIVKERPPHCRDSFGSYLPRSNVIAVSPRRLREYSAFPFDEIVSSTRDDISVVSMRATAPAYALLLGVEECHHGVYRQVHGVQPLPANTDQLSGTEYDALDHEFEALGFQIMAAKEYNLHEVTQAVLVQRWIAAEALRQRS